MTILATNIEPQYTPYGHLIALRINLTNKVNENRKAEVFITVKLQDMDKKPEITSKSEKEEVELRGLETTALDVLIEPPLRIKDGNNTTWTVAVVEKK